MSATNRNEVVHPPRQPIEDPFPTVWRPMLRLTVGLESLDLQGRVARFKPKRLAAALQQAMGDLGLEQTAMTTETVRRLRTSCNAASVRVEDDAAGGAVS